MQDLSKVDNFAFFNTYTNNWPIANPLFGIEHIDPQS
jgi:hypothetical protein